MRVLATLLPGIVSAFLCVGCGQRDAGEEGVPDLPEIGYSRNKDEFIKLAKEKGVAGLKPLLKNKQSKIRIVAITSLGTLEGNKEATELLVQVVNGEDSEDAYHAIIALAIQGSPEAKKIIETAIKSKDARRREGACCAIVEYGDESLFPLLDVAEEDEDPGVQNVARMMKTFIGRVRVGS